MKGNNGEGWDEKAWGGLPLGLLSLSLSSFFTWGRISSDTVVSASRLARETAAPVWVVRAGVVAPGVPSAERLERETEKEGCKVRRERG